MSPQQPARVAWRKSSYSGPPEQNCIEVATIVTGSVSVRDSKDAAGPALVFTLAEWVAFVQGVRAGEFDLERAVPGLPAAAPGPGGAG